MKVKYLDGFKDNKPPSQVKSERAIVKTIQTLLQKQGYKIKADGLFGKETRKAVKDFQQKNKLKPTGEVTIRVYRLLSGDYRLGDRVIDYGDRGSDVKVVQQKLNLLGAKLLVDGIYGEATRKEVLKFRALHRLPISQKIDDLFISKLISESRKVKEEIRTELPKKPLIFFRKKGVIVLDVQHKGKVSSPSDLGAQHLGFIEAIEVDNIFTELKKVLSKEGYEVIKLISDVGKPMDYFQRHNYVNAKFGKNLALYLAGHLNAGKGSYGLFGYGNKTFASIFATTFKDEFQFDYKLKSIHEGIRGYSCIKGVKEKAVLCEPFFIDNQSHQKILRYESKRIVNTYFQAIKAIVKG